ncbi:MAG: MBL fold metallo-hydrolase [Pseudomonadota bacterium]
MKTRSLLLSLLAALLALALGTYLLRVPLGMAMLKRGAAQRLGANPTAGLPDGLYVALCGAGSPLPDPKRGAPCAVVIAGKRMFMIDAGTAAARNLGRMNFNPGELEALFLTHFHSDHIDGIGELQLQRWAGAAHHDPLPVYGPRGVELVVDGVNQAYAQDKQYRVAHHGAAVVPPEGAGVLARGFDTPPANGRVVLIDEPDLQIVAFSVTHAPVHPSVGYRIRYKDRTVVFSGDTVKSAAVQREAEGVDLLVHEALAPQLVALIGEAAGAAGRPNLVKIFKDIPDYHTSPPQAAAVARDAQVGMLLLNHIVPALPSHALDAAFLGEAPSIYKGKLRIGEDGDVVSLPAGSKTITIGTF